MAQQCGNRLASLCTAARASAYGKFSCISNLAKGRLLLDVAGLESAVNRIQFAGVEVRIPLILLAEFVELFRRAADLHGRPGGFGWSGIKAVLRARGESRGRE